MSSLSILRGGRLTLHVATASGVSALAVVLVCGIGLHFISRTTQVTQRSLTAQTSFLEQESAFELLLYQKGFVTEYLFTHDQSRLDKLEQSRHDFSAWFARARAG